MFDFSIVTNWIHELLLSIMPEGLAIFIECVAVGVCLVALYAILAIILIYMERKVCGFFQCRLGPNRVGKWGSIQVVCDVLKMMTKEIFMPKGADHFLYNLAPFMVIIASFLTFACILLIKVQRFSTLMWACSFCWQLPALEWSVSCWPVGVVTTNSL